jgi:23S rRNA (adenine2503-C2)-methyltransferase
MTKTEKTNIKTLSFSEIEDFFTKKNIKPFRAKQVYEWLWKKSACSFAQMTNISKDIRQLLKNSFIINTIKVNKVQISSDRTIKTSFKLIDDNIIEGVLIPTKNRMTACISTQVGCNLKCKFCATGKMDFKRNLSFTEIYDQIIIINKQAVDKYSKHLSNIVYMGMGEPLLNYDNVIKSIEIITSEKGLGMSPQRITVSSVGITKMIRQLADDNAKFNLAISLHSADNKKRTSAIPVNESNPLKELAQALKYYYEKTNKRITYEYILFKNFNDSISDAEKFAKFCKITPCKINIIEYNPVENTGFYKSGEKETNDFINFFENKNMIVNIRKSRGKDIDAACGQLANKDMTKKNYEL